MNKEYSSEYPLGGLIEGDEIEKEKEMTNELLDLFFPKLMKDLEALTIEKVKRFPSKDAELLFKGDESRYN